MEIRFVVRAKEMRQYGKAPVVEVRDSSLRNISVVKAESTV